MFHMHFVLVQTVYRTKNRNVPLSFLLEVYSTMQGYRRVSHFPTDHLKTPSPVPSGSQWWEKMSILYIYMLKYHLHGSMGFLAVPSVLPAVGICTMLEFRSLGKQELGMWGSFASLIYKKAVCLVRAKNTQPCMQLEKWWNALIPDKIVDLWIMLSVLNIVSQKVQTAKKISSVQPWRNEMISPV